MSAAHLKCLHRKTDVQDAITHVRILESHERPYEGCFAHWLELNLAWNSIIRRGWFIRSSERAPANIPFNCFIGKQSGLCCATGPWHFIPTGEDKGYRRTNYPADSIGQAQS